MERSAHIRILEQRLKHAHRNREQGTTEVKTWQDGYITAMEQVISDLQHFDNNERDAQRTEAA